MLILLVRLEVFMSSVATTKMSSKGQVVIPEEIRERLNLAAGTQFIVLGQGDAVVLKIISPPNSEEFKELLKKSKSAAKKEGFKKADLETIIKKVRSEK